MNPFQENAQNLVKALENAQSLTERYELVISSPILWLYQRLTNQNLSSLTEEGVVRTIWWFAQKIASGEIKLPGEEKPQNNVPQDIKRLLEEYQRAKESKTPTIVDRQVLKALIDAWVREQKIRKIADALRAGGSEEAKTREIAEKIVLSLAEAAEKHPLKEEGAKSIISNLAQESGVQIPTQRVEEIASLQTSGLLPKTIWQGLQTFRLPLLNGAKEKEAEGKKPDLGKTREEKRQEFLIRISYKDPSVLEEVTKELSFIPKSLFTLAQRDEAGVLPILIQSGISPRNIRSALQAFKEAHPGAAETLHKSLEFEIEAFEKSITSEVAVALEKYADRVKIDFLPPEEEEQEGRENAKFIRAIFRFTEGERPEFKIIKRPLPRTGDGLEAKGASITAREAKKGFAGLLQKTRLPVGILAKARVYLGSAFLLAGIGLPLPLPLRAGFVVFGTSLLRKQIASFFHPSREQLQGAKKLFSFGLSGFFKKSLSALFTKPALGWLRTTIATAFGLGGLFLPLPLPIRLLFLGTGGTFGLAQVGRFSGSILGGLGRIGILTGQILGRVSFALISAAPISGTAIAVLIGVAIGGALLFSYLNIQTHQSTFLTSGTIDITGIESRYIEITKTVDFSVLKNEDLPKTVNVRIIIRAKEGNISAISVKEGFTVSKSGDPQSLPDLVFSPSGDSLAPGESTEIQFSLPLDTLFEDSLVLANTTVSADVDLGNEKKRESTTKSLSIVIGSPPTSCFAFSGNNWTEADMALVRGAIGHISRAQSFVAKICAKGEVPLIRHHTNPGYSGEVTNTNNVHFYNNAFTSQSQMFYTFTHEIGHVYGNRNSEEFNRFRQIYGGPPTYNFFPTYPEWIAKTLTLDQRISEDFAENIAIYVIWKVVPVLSGYNLSDLIGQRPAHYSFAKNTLFGEVEF